MVVNIKLSDRTAIDPVEDPVLQRTWFGWDPDASEEELWEHNRGRYRFSERVLREGYTSLSYRGEVVLVAQIRDRQPAPKPGKDGNYWALVAKSFRQGTPRARLCSAPQRLPAEASPTSPTRQSPPLP